MATRIFPLSNLFSGNKNPAPTKEAGSVGFAVDAGFIRTNERNPKLGREKRYETWADIVANISIVAASLRFRQQLIARPTWTVVPALDIDGEDSSDEAKAHAEFVEKAMDGLATGWTSQVRKASTFELYGFYVAEWTGWQNIDGLRSYVDLEPRPQHTIERWDVDSAGNVLGFGQRNPQDSSELYIPRWKAVYVVDGALTDSPEGLGLLRQVTEPAERLKAYLRLEGFGFERDLRGLPVGRAPIAAMNEAVAEGRLSKEDRDKLISSFRAFVEMEKKEKDTGLVLDSATYKDIKGDGEVTTSEKLWGLEILSANTSGLKELGGAIERVNHEIARVLGTESLLLGGTGSSGNRSLSEDKSRNLYLQTDAALDDLAEAMGRDFIGPLWKYNGLDDRYKPRFEVESVQPKDVEGMFSAIRDMSSAGVMLDRDDEATGELFDMLGLTRPEQDALVATLRSGVADQSVTEE